MRASGGVDEVVLVVVVWLVEVVVVTLSVLEVLLVELLDELLGLVVLVLEVWVVPARVTWIARGTLTATGDTVFPKTYRRSPTSYVPGASVTFPLKTPPPVEVVVTAPAVMFSCVVWTTLTNSVFAAPMKLVVTWSWSPEATIRAPPSLKE